MNFFSILSENKERSSDSDKYALLSLRQSQHNITDGSEFLDDAIRTYEQPLMLLTQTEESIAAGSPRDLL